MFRFIKFNIDTYTKVLKLLGINMEPTLELPNASNIPNTMALKGLYNRLLTSRLHSFPYIWQDIIFIIDGQCCVLLEMISSLEKIFMRLYHWLKETRCLGRKLTFLKEDIQDSLGSSLTSQRPTLNSHQEFRAPLVAGIH